jgi:hypothetical protein
MNSKTHFYSIQSLQNVRMDCPAAARLGSGDMMRVERGHGGISREGVEGVTTL